MRKLEFGVLIFPTGVGMWYVSAREGQQMSSGVILWAPSACLFEIGSLIG